MALDHLLSKVRPEALRGGGEPKRKNPVKNGSVHRSLEGEDMGDISAGSELSRSGLLAQLVRARL